MAKDPAFLFYPGDWLGGTMTFTRHHKGAYMDLLMAQFNNGHLSINDIEHILGVDMPIWEFKLKQKFISDSCGLFYNKKLEEEVCKRRNFTASRKHNLESKHPHMDKHMVSHMENENENRNIIKDSKGVVRGGFDFALLWAKYPNKDGKKAAERHFQSEVKTEQDWQDINTALKNYLESDVVKKGFIKNGSTWFNNWRDWIVPPKKEVNDGIPKQFRHLVSNPKSGSISNQ